MPLLRSLNFQCFDTLHAHNVSNDKISRKLITSWRLITYIRRSIPVVNTLIPPQTVNHDLIGPDSHYLTQANQVFKNSAQSKP